MEKKNTALVITIIFLILIILGLGGYLVYDKVINKEIDANTDKNEITEKENIEASDKNEITEQESNEAINNLVGNYRYSFTHEETDTEYVQELQLKEDNTFIMSVSFFAGSGYEGTYTVNNGILKLNSTKSYGSDACYYNKNETFNYEITSSGTLLGNVVTLSEEDRTNPELQKTSNKLLEIDNMLNAEERINCDNLN